MQELRPDENELVGMWLDLGSRATGDAVADRIEWLISSRLEKLAGDRDEPALYRDPGDGRLWELTSPIKGGPPRIKVVTPEQAQEKYQVAVR